MYKILQVKPVILVGVLNLILFAIFADTLLQLFKFWSESYAYSHGVILLPIVLGIYFYELNKRDEINLNLVNPFSTLCLLGLGVIWFIADLSKVQVIEFFSFFLILILVNILLTSRSRKTIHHIWPLLLIVFTLPIWDFLTEILRTIETPIVTMALKLSFIDAFQDGFLIYVPAGTFLVENACSGFNQFIVSIPLASLYLYSRGLNISRGYKFIVLLLLLAMLFNTLRIYIIIIVGNLTHMKASLVTDHEYLAWLIYGIGVFILFFIADRRINKIQSNSARESENFNE